ncbi:hypothetical protein HDU93_009933 [Gonapodya sp. JEL0774]|nr:hypothetical protein HDU93_009933 [Gonapodya sp. JEL0774]
MAHEAGLEKAGAASAIAIESERNAAALAQEASKRMVAEERLTAERMLHEKENATPSGDQPYGAGEAHAREPLLSRSRNTDNRTREENGAGKSRYVRSAEHHIAIKTDQRRLGLENALTIVNLKIKQKNKSAPNGTAPNGTISRALMALMRDPLSERDKRARARNCEKYHGLSGTNVLKAEESIYASLSTNAHSAGSSHASYDTPDLPNEAFPNVELYAFARELCRRVGIPVVGCERAQVRMAGAISSHF